MTSKNNKQGAGKVAQKAGSGKSAAPKSGKTAKTIAKSDKTASDEKMDAAVQSVLDSAVKAAPQPTKSEPAAITQRQSGDTGLSPRPSDAVAVKPVAAVPSVKQNLPPAVKSAGTVVVQEKAAALGKEASASAAKNPLQEIVGAHGAMKNPYLPEVGTVMEVIQETSNIKTLRVVLDNADAMRDFHYSPGQVGQLSLFGVGEATFVINSPPSQKNYLQFSIMRAGEVSTALHTLSPGDKVGVRAPLGNSFPYADWKGKNVFFVGGGIGMAPIRTIMLHLLENKADYGKISLLYGARTPRDMAYSYEAEDWLRRPDLDCTLTIDAPFEGWEHKVGLIPHVLTDLNPVVENTIAVLCGPPVMIKFTVEALKKLGFPDASIVTTLERRMKCGVGLCGRCNLGGKYICVDGPVFTWAELKDLPAEL